MQSIPFGRRIGTKIIAIFFVALLPLVAIIAYLNIQMRRDAVEHGRNMVFRAVFEAATVQEGVLSELRRQLHHLADLHETRTLDAVALDRSLGGLVGENHILSNLAVCDPTGTIVASARKPFAGVNVGDRAYFQEALHQDGLVIGEYAVGQVTKTPVIHMALPVKGPLGAVVGVVVAGLNLRYFPEIFSRLQVPRGALLAVLDAHGLLLTRCPLSRAIRPGQRVTDFFGGKFSWDKSYGSFLATGPGQVETIYAYRVMRLSAEDSKPYGAIVIGLPVAVAMDAARSRMLVSVAASAASLLAAVLLAVGLSRVTIVRRLEVLAGFAASLRQDKVCRLPPHFGRDEIGLLGERLVDMSRELHDKSDRLTEAMSSLGRERDQLSTVVGQLSEAHNELERLASQDFLTGLRNRRCFNEKMHLERERLLRYGTPFSLILFDIDDFKKINDTHGHNLGDEVLRQLGRLALGTVRSMDEAYRVGGEEFAVILPGTEGEKALVLAERFRDRVAQLAVPLPGDGVVRFTVSLGVAQAWPGAAGEKAIYAAADAALYAAKRSGKNRSVLWSDQNAV